MVPSPCHGILPSRKGRVINANSKRLTAYRNLSDTNCYMEFPGTRYICSTGTMIIWDHFSVRSTTQDGRERNGSAKGSAAMDIRERISQHGTTYTDRKVYCRDVGRGGGGGHPPILKIGGIDALL